MNEAQRSKQGPLKWALIWFVWTLAALFLTSQVVTQSRATGQSISFWRALLWQLVSGYALLSLVPIMLWLGRRFRFEQRTWRRRLPLHLVAGCILAALHQAIDARVLPWLGYPPGIEFGSYFETYKFFLLLNFHLNLTIYWVVIGAQHGISYYLMYRERELRASRLEAKLAESRLQLLRTQLQPHFLFNTLNAIAELVYKNPEAAEQMIAHLSDLLRLALDASGRQEAPLAEELEFLRKYLEIEQMRFDDRLRVEINVDPQALDARVPNMILQPLVENAIRHGIAPLAEGGTVAVRAGIEDGHLHLQVRDDGKGLTGVLTEGVGLSNTRERLRQLYGTDHSFAMRSGDGRGVELDLRIPYRSARSMMMNYEAD